jgi:hypothetical protein
VISRSIEKVASKLSVKDALGSVMASQLTKLSDVDGFELVDVVRQEVKKTKLSDLEKNANDILKK